MCGDTLSLTVDQINRLSLPLRLSVPTFSYFPPHLTDNACIFSLCLFFLFFSPFSGLLTIRCNTESLYLPFLRSHSHPVPQYLCEYQLTYLQQTNFFKI